MNKKVRNIWGVALTIFITTGFILALWLTSGNITGYSVYKIKSNQPNLTITRFLVNQSLDTQNNSVNFTDSFKIESTDKMKAILTLESVKIDDVNDSCIDYENDCSINYFYGDYSGYGIFPPIEEVFNGDTINLQQGENQFIIYVECVKLSCPQEIISILSLTPKHDE